MSLKILKAGLFDTIQDGGRNGFRHLGINPCGFMDRFSAQLGNALLGKDLNAPLIEMHFPASTILFEKPCIICITGADFTPVINGQPIRIAHPIYVPFNSILEFKKQRDGAWCYLSLLSIMDIQPWLNSYSTNTKIVSGGFKGRPFKKGDILRFKDHPTLPERNNMQYLHWHAKQQTSFNEGTIGFLKGSEWNGLNTVSKQLLETELFQVLHRSERMAYYLENAALKMNHEAPLISSAVAAGTMQLLPNGQIIVLMADHQTTGGYPRIGQIMSTDISVLAQKQAGSFIRFKSIDLKTAEQKVIEQQNDLEDVRLASSYNIENFIHAL